MKALQKRFARVKDIVEDLVGVSVPWSTLVFAMEDTFGKSVTPLLYNRYKEIEKHIEHDFGTPAGLIIVRGKKRLESGSGSYGFNPRKHFFVRFPLEIFGKSYTVFVISEQAAGATLRRLYGKYMGRTLRHGVEICPEVLA